MVDELLETGIGQDRPFWASSYMECSERIYRLVVEMGLEDGNLVRKLQEFPEEPGEPASRALTEYQTPPSITS